MKLCNLSDNLLNILTKDFQLHLNYLQERFREEVISYAILSESGFSGISSAYSLKEIMDICQWEFFNNDYKFF